MPRKQASSKPKKQVSTKPPSTTPSVKNYFLRVTRSTTKTHEKIDFKEKYLKKNVDPDNFEIIESDEKGKGVTSKVKIPKNEFVCEYAGDLVKFSEAKIREKNYENEHLGCYLYFFNFKGKRFCIDATKPNDRIGRLINHSRKKPNLKTKIIDLDGKPRLIFISLREISPGEELTYDYGDRSKEAIAAHPWLNTS
ncbi:histone-lysine N-methyltransferase set-1-like [Tetranychus urticae]|uniref:SET domain-containing protein n=1 Tax=Tetranychus urticae TaxID=32264 RepID=T1KT89_TETUR|nr:histone-lysine N-methyltransferase set-1-like [Tetranychus urticae]